MTTEGLSIAGSVTFCRRRGIAVGQRHSQTSQGTWNVFDFVLAKVVELDLDAIAHLPEGIVGERDATRLGQRFEPRGDVDALSVDIFPLGNDVAEMHAHAKLERSIAFRRMGLPAKRAFDGIDYAGEFGQIAVAHTLDDAALVLGDGRFDDASLIRLQQFQRARLIRAHQTRIAHHVCIEHCGETTFHRTLRSARRPSGIQVI